MKIKKIKEELLTLKLTFCKLKKNLLLTLKLTFCKSLQDPKKLMIVEDCWWCPAKADGGKYYQEIITQLYIAVLTEEGMEESVKSGGLNNDTNAPGFIENSRPGKYGTYCDLKAD